MVLIIDAPRADPAIYTDTYVTLSKGAPLELRRQQNAEQQLRLQHHIKRCRQILH
jgi:hypothetical protein